MVTVAYPDCALDEISVGACDALLLRLRVETFGDALTFRAACPHCACLVTGSVQTRDLLVDSDGSAADSMSATLEADGYRLELRAPTISDLKRAGEAAGSADPLVVLLQCCVRRAERHGKPVEVDDLPQPIVAAISERLAELDPQADLTLRLSCPDCGRDWRAPFDIAAFVWEEIASEAPRLLREVHALARAYGWREADILAMSPMRRQTYLELIDAG